MDGGFWKYCPLPLSEKWLYIIKAKIFTLKLISIQKQSILVVSELDRTDKGIYLQCE
jgi:hypothetical protein